MHWLQVYVWLDIFAVNQHARHDDDDVEDVTAVLQVSLSGGGLEGRWPAGPAIDMPMPMTCHLPAHDLPMMGTNQ